MNGHPLEYDARRLLAWCVPVVINPCVFVRPCVELYPSKCAQVENHFKIHREYLFVSRVRGSVTDNNGFLIGWLDLLTASFTVSRDQNQIQ
jgi:hypothetical protein